jgi:hypothetical protein
MLSAEAIIAIVTLLITCPTAFYVAWKMFRRLHAANEITIPPSNDTHTNGGLPMALLGYTHGSTRISFTWQSVLVSDRSVTSIELMAGTQLCRNAVDAQESDDPAQSYNLSQSKQSYYNTTPSKD